MSLNNVTSILFNGYYEDKELYQHTQETLNLYKKGFDVFAYLVEKNTQDYYEGVERGDDGIFYAKAFVDGAEKYVKLEL